MVDKYGCFGGDRCFHLQGKKEKMEAAGISLKPSYLSTKEHKVKI
jgi:hypothetical protein